MTSNLDELAQALRQATIGSLRLVPSENATMGEIIEQLRVRFGERISERPPADVVREAVERFFLHQTLRDSRHARLICYGCADPVLSSGYRLIEDEERFPTLLDSLRRFWDRPGSFRPCYLGLLHAYFGYNGAEAISTPGRNNWRALRDFLRNSAGRLAGSATKPSWVESLYANEPLLGDDPGRHYGEAALDRGYEEFDRLRRELNIRQDSWLVWSIVLGEVNVATARADGQFIELIPKLIALMAKTPPTVDKGLAKLLSRYRNCVDHSVHDVLRDYAVAQWGNPWLVANRGKWSLVPDEAREMVAGWLKRDLIRRFFSLLSADGVNDTRRLAFWESYYTSIDDMYFALGRNALTRQGVDYRKIRADMQSRLLELHSAGPNTNNAFIMCIGSLVVVEFGVRGNACYIFKRGGLPFALERSIAGNSDALKHPRHEERLLHIDSNAEEWESKFRRILFNLAGATPAALGAAPLPLTPGRDRAAPLPPRHQPGMGAYDRVDSAGSSDAPATPYTLAVLRRFCAERQLEIVDFRAQNGCLWVRTHDQDYSVAQQLRSWGFTYKNPHKGWWRT